MDILFEIADTLDKDDQKEFVRFLNRFRLKRDRKDLELFLSLLPQTGNDSKKKKTLSWGKDAYHACRKRLFTRLVQFIHLKRSTGDPGSPEFIQNLISLSGYLFQQKKEKPAWRMLRKAENMALMTEDYILLDRIYSLQVENCHSEFAPDLNAILDRKKRYQVLALEDDRASTAYNLVRFELGRALSTGQDIEIEKLIGSVLEEYGLKEKVTERPRLLYNIVAILRTAVLARKDYYQFEPYLIRMYSEALEKKSFTRHTHYYKLGMLYMIAHVLYRNKRFAAAARWLESLWNALYEFDTVYFHEFYPRYILLRAAVLNYSGRNQEAIDLLEDTLSGKAARLDTLQALNTNLNLSIYYFQKGEFGKSIRIFRNVQHSDKWLTKIMGREWVLKKNIIECINQFELGNSEIVETRLKQICRDFKDLFQRPLYKRVETFLDLVRMLNNDPGLSSKREFHELVEKSFVFVEAEKEDIQAMTFFGWLKARMERRRYYEVLLELVN